MKLNSLKWSKPYLVEDIRENRKIIPTSSGVYIFTLFSEEISRNTGILYIGKAKSLRKRLASYLVSPSKMLILSSKRKNKISSSLRHSGKNLLLMEIQQKSRYGSSGVWLRWFECTKPEILEKELIIYFKPGFNTSLNTIK